MKRAIAILLALAVAGVLTWRIVVKIGDKTGGQESRGRGPRPAVAVELAPVTTGAVRDVSQFTGSLHPRSQFTVAPKIAGRLEKLTVDMGHTVQSGQLIAELDDDEYTQQVEQARAELTVAQASVAECKSALTVAENEFRRVKELHDKKIASDSERDEVEARYTAAVTKHAVALAEVTRRKAALKAAEVRLSYTRIHAAWTDNNTTRVVGERYVHEGDMLQANTPIVFIVDNSVMIASIDVIERDYPKIRAGQRDVFTTDGFPGREFSGQVVRIAPLLKELSRQARVEIEIANPERVLKPGMFVRARIEFGRHQDTTIVPVSSLARRDGRQGVFLANQDRTAVRFVPVTVGIVEGEKAEIVEPPLQGSVVTLGHHLLEDGAPIHVPESAPPGPAQPQPDGAAGPLPGDRP